MAFNFPASPSNGDTYTANGFTYEWDGSKWIRKSPSTGAQGGTGPTGAQGATGSTGAQGATGPTGAQGATGSTGPTGPSGATGAQGATGSGGATGAQGATGSGGSTGAQGAEGNFGGATFYYTFESNTTNANPGSGDLRLDNSTQNAATGIYICDTDEDGTDIASYLQTIDDSTSTIKGHVKITNKLDSSQFILFTISSLTDNTGYFDITVSPVDSSATNPFSANEDILITFARTGDKGDTGAQGATGATGAQGATGNTGATGAQGSTGSTGAQGATGSTGPTGSSGSATLTNVANNRVMTAVSGTTLNAESALTFDGNTLTVSAPSNDTPLIVDTASTNGAHLRFQKDGSNQHFVGAGGGISLGDREDLSLRAYDNILFATGNSSTEKLRIDSNGNIAHNSGGGGISYFKGSSEYIFGSQYSSPSAGGPEALFQIHHGKSRATVSINGYYNNSGAPILQFVSSRSNTIGVLGTKAVNGDYIGDIRFFGDNGTNGSTLVQSAAIQTFQRSNISDGDTVAAGEISFSTGTATGGSLTEKLKIGSSGQVDIGTSGVLKAVINNSVSGHQFISQCDDNNNGFEIYQQHGSTSSRNTLAVYNNSTGSKHLNFYVRGDNQVWVSTNKDSTALVIDGTSSGTAIGETGGRIEFLMLNQVNQFTGNFAARIAPFLDRGNNGFGLRFDVRHNASTTFKALELTSDYEVLPGVNSVISLGNSSQRWSNIFTNDLNLSNQGKTNDVDGTWGDYTIQEGESDLFLINNRNGKKYQFMLKEVS